MAHHPFSFSPLNSLEKHTRARAHTHTFSVSLPIYQQSTNPILLLSLSLPSFVSIQFKSNAFIIRVFLQLCPSTLRCYINMIGARPTPDLEGTQIIKDSLPPGESKGVINCDGQQFDNTVPCEDTFVNNDDFDTQVMDLDGDIETQPVDSDDETQVMDLAGETQVMDDYDFDEDVYTQLLDISDNEDCEGKRDDEVSEATQPLDNAVGSVDVQVEDITSLFRQDDGKYGAGTMPLDNVSQSSGSSKRGFASVRTASLQTAGLAAHQTALKIADCKSHGTVLNNLSIYIRPFDDIGFIANSEKIGAENEFTKCNEEGLTAGDKSDVARSLARKLFTEEVAIEMDSDADVGDKSKDLSQFPPCDDNLAGLSYVDSQEPGELSQINALEFVDRFLKVNTFDSDQGVKCKNVVGETGTPDSITKGVQSIAQKASRRSTLSEASIYEWDDNLEDEGGGEFFTKKKEVLLGYNSCLKPRSSQHCNPRVSQSVDKLRDVKEPQVVHDTTMSFPRSDLKSVKGGEKVKVKKTVVEENNCSDQHLEALPSVQSMDTQNVGIDTQMAAEAMEALSTGIALLNNGNCVAEQDCRRENKCSENKAMEDGTNQSSHQKRAWLSTSGIVTRSRTKRIIINSAQESKCHSPPQTRRRSIMGKLGASLVKPNEKQNRSSINDNLAVNRREPSESGPVSVGGKRKESALGKLTIGPSRQLKRQSLGGKSSILTPPVQENVQRIGDPTDTYSNHRGVVVCLEAVHETRSTKRNCEVSKNFNKRKEAVNITTDDNDMVDGLHCKTMNSIPRLTRSRRSSVQGTECSQRGLLSSRLLSAEDSCQLSSKKLDASTPPAKGALASTTVDVTPENMQKPSNQLDVTPIHLKTSTSAVSPVCIGDGYQTPTCKRRLSLQKECINLISSENRYSSVLKGLRQRRDLNTVRVLFSQHLDGDIIRQQKKILYRLGVSEASTILEATHFVANAFTRTRNMLEAIANGKPVVTQFWLESCGQANCFIDEKNYILRDAKKEKELGFSMPNSLARASHYPLLEGKKVLITPNLKPGKEVISSLVKAVRGQPVQRLGRSISNNNKLLDDLLVLSCEEDFGVSVPLLEKGIAVYSSELLLNGIITQRLEYERYRLFVSHVKKTRSTLWLKKGKEQAFTATKIK